MVVKPPPTPPGERSLTAAPADTFAIATIFFIKRAAWLLSPLQLPERGRAFDNMLLSAAPAVSIAIVALSVAKIQ